MDGTRARLRQASAQWHQQVDDAFSGFDLDTPAGYGGFLQAHALALLPLEEALEAAGIERLLPDWEQRRRRFVLTEDLRALALPVPRGEPLSVPNDDAWLWGAGYVIEGSRMGSRMLGQRLRQAAHPWAAASLGYLCHRLDEPLWPAFVRRLEAADPEALDEPRLLAGVRDTFALFLQAGTRREAPAPV